MKQRPRLVVPGLRKLRQQDRESRANQNNIMKLCSKRTNQSKAKTKWRGGEKLIKGSAFGG